MNSRIIAKNKQHLKSLIEKEIRLNGENCDLNHLGANMKIKKKEMKQLINICYILF